MKNDETKEIEMEENETDFDEKVRFFESICAQLQDVRNLKQQYEKEFAITGHVPAYKRVPSATTETAKMDKKPLVERNAPALTQDEMKALYSTLQLGTLFTVETLATMWNVNMTEVRRRCFWLKRHRFVRFVRSHEMYEALPPGRMETFNPRENWTWKHFSE